MRRQLGATRGLHGLLDEIAFDTTPGEKCVRVNMHSKRNHPGKWTNYGYAPREYGLQDNQDLVAAIEAVLVNGQGLPRKRYNPHRTEILFDYAA